MFVLILVCGSVGGGGGDWACYKLDTHYACGSLSKPTILLFERDWRNHLTHKQVVMGLTPVLSICAMPFICF